MFYQFILELSHLIFDIYWLIKIIFNKDCISYLLILTFDLNLCPQVAKAVSHALNNCMNCLPGQRDVDRAIKSVVEASKGLMSGRVSLLRLLNLIRLRCLT